MPLAKKIGDLMGFRARKPPSRRQGPDRRLFSCAAFTTYYEGRYKGHKVAAKKPDYIDEFTPKNTGINQW